VKDYEPPEAEKKVERILIYKNVLLISVSFLLLFVAFESMSKLQSSINTVGDDQSGTVVTIGTNFTVIKFVFFLQQPLFTLCRKEYQEIIAVYQQPPRLPMLTSI
jgi:hypothetical protein